MGLGKLKKPEKQINTVLGLDISTNSVAFCLYDKTGPIRWGEVVFKGKNTFERIGDANSKVSVVFKDFNPDMICFEAATYIQSRETVILLSYAFGAILGAIMKPGVVVEKIPPITWQNAIGNPAFTKYEKEDLKKEFPDKNKAALSEIMRQRRKERTERFVKDTFGIDVPNDNVSDSIAIAHVAYGKYGA